MGTRLVIGTRSLCAASFSAWLVLRRAGLQCSEIVVPLHQRDGARRLRELSPTGSVPCLVMDGVPITGPMGIADHAAWRMPSLWPDAELRELARRSAVAAAHGLAELAAFLPMDMAAHFGPPGPPVRPVREGLARLFAIWDECRTASSAGGDFLFGRFGIVDAMMAPWASRLLTHAIPLDQRHAAYVETLRSLPEWAEWEGSVPAVAPRTERVAQAAVQPALDAKVEAAPEPVAKDMPVPARPVPEPELVAVEPEPMPPIEEPAPLPEPVVETAPLPEPAVETAPPPVEPEPGAAAAPAAKPAAARPLPGVGQIRPSRRPGLAPPAPPPPPLRRRPVRTLPSIPGAAVGGVSRVRATAALVAVAVVGTAAVLALPHALATIGAVAPYLRDAIWLRETPAHTTAATSDALLPAALRADEPTEAETALHPRVVVHYSGAEAAAAQRLARDLADKGYEVAIRPVDVPIARPSVRYYFAGDRAATVELATNVGQSLDGRANPRVLDLSHQRSKPRPGTLEVWIGPARG